MNPGTDEQLLGIPVASLGVMIVFAGVSKLFYLKQFRSTLVQVPYVSVPLARLASGLLPASEILGGLGLLFGEIWGIAIVVALLFGISVVAILARLFDRRIPCVCFTSTSTDQLSLGTAARNSALIVIALLAPRSAPPIQSAMVMTYGITLLLLWNCAGASREFFRLKRQTGRQQ
jgi:hypothetical protein